MKLNVPARIAGGGLVVVGIGALLARAIGRAAISSVYGDAPWPLVQRILAGWTTHVAADYTNALDAALLLAAAGAGVVVLLLSALSSARVRGALDRALDGPGPVVAEPAGTSVARLRWPTVVLVGFVLLQCAAIATRLELWPFSPYAMYSSVQGRNVHWFRLVAVTDSGERVLDGARIAPPFPPVTLAVALDALVSSGDSVATRRALVSLAQLYERARRDEGIDARRTVRALRLYRVDWTIDRELRNAGTPDHAALIAEQPLGR